MVTVPRPPPTAERQREYDKARGAYQGLIRDPEAAIEQALSEPLKFSEPDEKKERIWHKDPGIWVIVWRLPNGRFARNPYRNPKKKRAPSRT